MQKKTDRLDKVITKYVRKFGVRRAFSGKEFCYYDNIDFIEYSIFHSPIETMWADHINNKYECDIKPFFFIFSLLHEIGHYKTLPTIPKEELEEELIIRKTLSDFISDQQEMNEVYTNLPSERAANEWALTYLEENTQACWEFQRKVFRILAHYYKKWGVRKSEV